MLVNLPLAFRSRRVGKKSSGSPTPPPLMGPRILSVTRVGDTQVLVTCSQSVVGIDETSQAIRLYLPGLYWLGSSGWGTDGNTVLFNFEESLATATYWVVPLPSVWLFEDAQELEGPFSGVVGE